ncbi:MAG TPA: sulfatase [Gaiellaceae bacterium]|nr:sulfatase [Gaiellaceae bacterium]
MERHRTSWTGLAVLALALVAACAGAGFGTPAVAHAAKTRPPNIVFVLSDDQRWDTLGAMPNVQKELVAHGVTFSDSFVPTSLCCPSRASILTGEYAHSTGVYLNIGPHGGFRAFDDSHTIATVLHGAGYTTGLFGKYLNRYGVAAADARYVPPGWDHWDVFLRKTKYYDYRLVEDGHVRTYGHDARSYSTDVLARKAVSFVQHARRPFFMELTPFGPHEPATPPPRYARAFAQSTWTKPPSFNAADVIAKPAYMRRHGALNAKEIAHADQFRRDQLAAGLAVDDAVGALVKALEARHQLANTMIVFASDNGVSWGEHQLVAARKLVPYEESIRVPLVIRYDPLTHGRPRQDRRLALNIDYAPTFAALAGRRMPGAEGRSLLPVLAGLQPAWRHDFLIEHLAGPPQADVPTYCGVRGERYKYVLYQTREEELYDLKLDPFELRNQASSPALAAVKDRLRARLSKLCSPRPPGYTVLGSPNQPG